jgi:hypothetical protein
MSGSSRLVTISWQRVQVSSCLGRRMNVTSPQKLNDAQNSSGLNEAIFVKKRGA